MEQDSEPINKPAQLQPQAEAQQLFKNNIEK